MRGRGSGHRSRSDFKKPSDIPANHTIWYAIDLDGDGKPDALKFAKQTPYGTKWTGGGNDGSAEAKQQYVMTTVNALRTPGNIDDELFALLSTAYHYIGGHVAC